MQNFMEEAKMDLLAPQVPFEPPERSAARIRYSKQPSAAGANASRPRQPRGAKNAENKVRTWRERMVFQAIICGAFLAALLLFNVLDTPLTNNVSNWVEQNLSYNILHEDGGLAAWADRVLGIFGNGYDMSEPAVVDTFSPTITVPLNIPAQSPSDSWIDENILRQLNEEADVYYENNRQAD